MLRFGTNLAFVCCKKAKGGLKNDISHISLLCRNDYLCDKFMLE